MKGINVIIPASKKENSAQNDKPKIELTKLEMMRENKVIKTAYSIN